MARKSLVVRRTWRGPKLRQFQWVGCAIVTWLLTFGLFGCDPAPNIVLPGEVYCCLREDRTPSLPPPGWKPRPSCHLVAGIFKLDPESPSHQFSADTIPAQLFIKGTYFPVTNSEVKLIVQQYYFWFELPPEASSKMPRNLFGTTNLFTAKDPAHAPIQIQFRAASGDTCWVDAEVVEVSYLAFTNYFDEKMGRR